MFQPLRRPIPLLLGIIVLFTSLFSQQAEAQTDQRCFPETGFCIAGRIRQFWEQNGGLPVFGYPITAQQEEAIEGQPFQVQWFERNRLELHPENARPYDVLIGRLGVNRLEQQERDWFTFPKSEPQDGCRFFAETGHNMCGDILAAWRASGLEFDGQPGTSEAESLALFGLPLSDVQTEEIEGQPYQVQWFERARFELHPENAPPYNVLLGLLGNEVHGPAMPPPPSPVVGTGSIKGRVFRSDTNAAIVDATVELNDASLAPDDPTSEVAEASTNSQGQYQFTGVKSGRYYMSIAARFRNRADMPCDSVGFTQDGWFAVAGFQESTGMWMVIATGIDKDEFTISDGATIQKNIDLRCK